MEISVALATDQRKVADCPRSMLLGSAVKLLIRAAVPVGGGGSGGVVFAPAGVTGCGAATGAFFLHPATETISNAPNAAAQSVRDFMFIGCAFPFSDNSPRILSLSLSTTPVEYCFRWWS